LTMSAKNVILGEDKHRFPLYDHSDQETDQSFTIKTTSPKV